MTIINQQYNYLFIHVPKAAGKSIKEYLVDHTYSRLRRSQLQLSFALEAIGSYASAKPGVGRWVPPMHGSGIDKRVRNYCHLHRLHTSAHLRADQLLEILGEEQYRAMYSFSFVRNPWDRCLSAYFYFRRKPHHPLHRLALDNSFEAFLLEQEQHGMPYIGQQTQWLFGEGREKLVDFIGKVERIELDMAWLGRKLSLPGGRFAAQANVSEARDRDYRGYYTAAAVDIVARSMQPDVELLGYSFE